MFVLVLCLFAEYLYMHSKPQVTQSLGSALQTSKGLLPCTKGRFYLSAERQQEFGSVKGALSGMESRRQSALVNITGPIKLSPTLESFALLN